MNKQGIKFNKGEFTTVPSKSARRGLPPKLQVIYMWLCEYSDENNLSFPARSTLAKDCGISVRALDDGIKHLERLGLVNKERRVVDNEYTSSLYTVNIVNDSAPPSANSAPPSAKNNTTPSANSAHRTQPIINSTHLTYIDSKESIVEVPKNIRLIYDFYIDKFGNNPNQFRLTDQRKAKIKLRLKQNGTDQLKQAIEYVANSPFHRGDNDRGWRADLDFIIRTQEQVERLAGQGQLEENKIRDVKEFI